ncbi:unnamed protein product, partial [Musa hybrid cultivar]
MDPSMKEFQQALVEVETEAEHLLLARHQPRSLDPLPHSFLHVTLLPKLASVINSRSRYPPKIIYMVKISYYHRSLGFVLACSLEFFSNIIVDQNLKLQSYVKEKSFLISERGALADWISP